MPPGHQRKRQKLRSEVDIECFLNIMVPKESQANSAHPIFRAGGEGQLMRICVLSEYFHPDNSGGTGPVMSGLVRHLKDNYQELEIDVITSKNLFRGQADAPPEVENWDGVSIRRIASPPPAKDSTRRRLLSNILFTNAVLKSLLLGRRKYDLVLVVTAPPVLPMAARAYYALTGTPYVYLVHDLFLDMALAMNILPDGGRSTLAMRNVQRKWFDAASRVVVLGRCMRDYVGQRYNVGNEKMEIIPIPANLQQIKASSHRTHFRTQHDLEGFVVLYAGNFARYQDFDTLLDAAAALRDRRDITFVFVGEGARRGHIEARIASESLTNVRLLPFVPMGELNDMLASANVSLVTLEKEIAGLAVPSKFYNILASGRPAVAVVNAKSEVSYIVQETQCGVQVDPENSAELESVLRQLADDPQRVAQMGHNARTVCEERFSREHICQQFYQLFEEVTSERSQRKAAKKKRKVETQTIL